jgi:glycosyltransferase involved in cell wall biosynthesis
MKILWHSNSIWSTTGYGVQSNLFVHRLKQIGHELIHPAFYGLQGTPLKSDDLLILPASKDAYGNDVLVADFQRWNADITITLIDAWIFNPNATSQIKWVPWFPVDCDPLPPSVAQILKTAYKPIVYSKFGVEKCKESGIAVEYVPHGVDTNVYAPMDKNEARKVLNMRDKDFVVSIVAANKGNPSRKAFDQQIRAFAEFNKHRPNSVLYLHTDMQGGYDGENIPRIIQLSGIDPKCIATPPTYEFMRGMITTDYMHKVYCASDVLMNVTRGEGFGVPIIEAMSCGTPAIVTDATAMPELVDAGAGYKVKVADKFFYMDTYQFTPSVTSIVDCLEQAYADKQSGELAKMGERARAGMVANYDADMVTEKYWKPVLEKIAGELADIKARTERRAQQRAEGRAKATGGALTANTSFLVGGDSVSHEMVIVDGQPISGSATFEPTVKHEPVNDKITITVTDSAGKSLSELVDIVATELDGRPMLATVPDANEIKTETAAD